MANFPPDGYQTLPVPVPNKTFTGGNPTSLLATPTGYPQFLASIKLGRCNSVPTGGVIVRIYNDADVLQETIDDAGTTPDLENAGGDKYGEVTSYGPTFAFFINNWNSLAIDEDWYATLQYTDACGNVELIRAINFFPAAADSLDVVEPSGVPSFQGVVCPFDFCGECQPQLWVDPGSGPMVQYGYWDGPVGNFVTLATELFPDNTIAVVYQTDGPNSNGAGPGFVSIWAGGGSATQYGLDAAVKWEVRVCDSVYKLNSCTQCCTYTTGLGDVSGLSFDATVAAGTAPFSVTSLVVGGQNIIPTGGLTGLADVAAILAALDTLGMGSWTSPAANLVSPLLTPFEIESITIVDSAGPAVTNVFTFTSSCA